MKKTMIMLLLIAGIISAGEKTSGVAFTSSDLPIVIINTNGKTIVDEPKIEADMGIIFNGVGVRNNLTDSMKYYRGKIGIEIRGSSSQMFPKKQYGFETRDSSGGDADVSFFGMPLESDWILSAQYNDKTLMRDVFTYSLSNSMGRYASRTRYCELVLNGEYMGVYMLFEKIKRDKGRVNITKLDSTGAFGDPLTGGYIFKIDKLSGTGNDGWYSSFLPRVGSPYKINYLYDFPKPEDITDVQKTYIKNYVAQVEGILYSSNYADTGVGYTKYVDLPSMVDFFLINEFARNVDGFRLSTYMYKDKDSKNPKLFFGPVWDFNHAYGNCDYYDAAQVNGWQTAWFNSSTSFQNSDMWQPPFWWVKVLQDSVFLRTARTRWEYLRKNQLSIPRVNAFIDSVASHIDEAQKRNFERWPILNTYVWPNAYVGGSYANEITYMKKWIADRTAWIDGKLTGGSLSAGEENGPMPQSFSVEQNYPNPFNPSTMIEYTVGTDAHSTAPFVSLKIFNTIGSEIATLVNERKNAGRYSVQFNASSLPSGLYYYRLQSGQYSFTKKMVLIK